MWGMNPLPSAVLKMIAVITMCPSSAMRACWASYNFRTNRSLLGSCHVTTLSSPHRTPKPFRTTPQMYFLHRRISLRWLLLLHLRSTHDKQLLELTCLFPTRSTTFGRLLLTLALAHRASTCYSLESISVPALLCTGIEIGYTSWHCCTPNCRSEMTDSVQVVDREWRSRNRYQQLRLTL